MSGNANCPVSQINNVLKAKLARMDSVLMAVLITKIVQVKMFVSKADVLILVL